MDSQFLTSLTEQPLEGLESYLSDFFMPLIIGSIVLTTLFIIFWVTSHINQRKVQQATLEIRDILKEMNQRDKQKNLPPREDSSQLL